MPPAHGAKHVGQVPDTKPSTGWVPVERSKRTSVGRTSIRPWAHSRSKNPRTNRQYRSSMAPSSSTPMAYMASVSVISSRDRFTSSSRSRPSRVAVVST
jgi:hypothetical protein